MSDEQLRASMASNTAALEAQRKEAEKAIQRIWQMNEEFNKGMAELKKSQDRTDAQMAQTDAQMAQTDALVARTEIQLEKTIRGIADLRKQTGHFINNDSLSNEEYFYRTMEAHPQLGNMAFHDVQRNMQLRNYDPEFDLVLFNDEAIAIIEVKKKAHPEEIPGMAEKQIQGFKTSFPQYAHYRFYFGVASMITNEALTQVAREERIFLLTRKGEELVMLNDNIRSL